MAKMILEFEKPIVELEQKMEEMRRYADNPDIAVEIVKIENASISSSRPSMPDSRAGRRFSSRVIPTGRTRSTYIA